MSLRMQDILTRATELEAETLSLAWFGYGREGVCKY